MNWKRSFWMKILELIINMGEGDDLKGVRSQTLTSTPQPDGV